MRARQRVGSDRKYEGRQRIEKRPGEQLQSKNKDLEAQKEQIGIMKKQAQGLRQWLISFVAQLGMESRAAGKSEISLISIDDSSIPSSISAAISP